MLPLCVPASSIRIPCRRHWSKVPWTVFLMERDHYIHADSGTRLAYVTARIRHWTNAPMASTIEAQVEALRGGRWCSRPKRPAGKTVVLCIPKISTLTGFLSFSTSLNVGRWKTTRTGQPLPVCGAGTRSSDADESSRTASAVSSREHTVAIHLPQIGNELRHRTRGDRKHLLCWTETWHRMTRLHIHRLILVKDDA